MEKGMLFDLKNNLCKTDILLIFFTQFRSGKNGQNTSSLKFFICSVERYTYFNNKCLKKRTNILHIFSKKPKTYVFEKWQIKKNIFITVEN